MDDINGGARKRTSGLKRNPIDKYYTSNKVAKMCYQLVKKYVKIKKMDYVIEPSAGSGVFIEYIKRLTNLYKFLDIKPEHAEIAKQNFLKYKIVQNREKLHIFGNPPFGRKSSTAIKFIKHSAALNADSISFILPRSFKKASFKKSFPLQYHLIVEKDLPEYSFIFNKMAYDVPCIFQIWERRDYNRKPPIKQEAKSWYHFVKRPDCTISIRRVGFSIGRVKRCTQNDNINSHWFMKIGRNDLHKIEKLNKIQFDKEKNTGAYSISKQDIILKYNKV
jgi:hypothetical protein